MLEWISEQRRLGNANRGGGVIGVDAVAERPDLGLGDAAVRQVQCRDDPESATYEFGAILKLALSG